MIRRIRFAALIFLLIFPFACQNQQNYPNRPIILICPWAAGGGTDRLSRQLAPFLEQDLGVPVNVVNATGGAGVTGHARGARARPDGHTLTMMTVEINMLHWRNLTEISWTDFEPVGMINRDPAALFVKKGHQWGDLETLIDYIKSHPGELRASGTATGGIWHLALAGWLDAAKLEVDSTRWIPMNGAGPSLQELLSGGLDLVCCSLPEARTLLEAGEIGCLGVMSEKRIEGYETVPTFREQGINWSLGGWRGIGLPKNTPAHIVSRVAEALERVLTGITKLGGTRFADVVKPQGFSVTFEPPEAFRDSLDRADQALGELLVGDDFSDLSAGPVGPMVFPGILLATLILILIALSLGQVQTKDHKKVSSRPSFSGYLKAAEGILCVVLFNFLAESVGFVLTGTLFTLYLLWRLGSRALTGLVIAIILVPLVYQLFANVLRVPLARGILGW